MVRTRPEGVARTRRPLVFSALAGMLGITLAYGCSIDDRNLEVQDGDQGGQSGQGGSSTGGSVQGGTGGSSGGKGGTSSGGTAGTAGKGGTAGTAGKGGTAGTAGTAGGTTVVDCAGDALAVDEEIIRGCVMQTGCSPFTPGATLSGCITYSRLATFPLDDCGTGVTSCDGYLQCRGWGHYAGSGCSAGATAFCEGANLAVYCTDLPYAIDCAQRGGVCAEVTGRGGTPTVDCLVLPSCSGSTTEATCYGSVLATCSGGVGYGSDCADTPYSVCRNGDCFYDLPACSALNTQSCGTPTRVDICNEDGYALDFECAGGLECLLSGGFGYCVAPGCTAATTCAESCNGTRLTLCYGAIPVEIDCTDYGFSECVDDMLSDGVTAASYCAFPL